MANQEFENRLSARPSSPRPHSQPAQPCCHGPRMLPSRHSTLVRPQNYGYGRRQKESARWSGKLFLPLSDIAGTDEFKVLIEG